MQAQCAAHFVRLEAKIDLLTSLLTGNSKPGCGIVVRMDRLEQKDARSTWVYRAVLGAMITGLGALMVSMFIHLKSNGGG